MFGLGIPIIGAFVGVIMVILCDQFQATRRFNLAAFVSPFSASIVFYFGVLFLADHPSDNGVVVLIAAAGAAVASAVICARIRR